MFYLAQREDWKLGFFLICAPSSAADLLCDLRGKSLNFLSASVSPSVKWG